MERIEKFLKEAETYYLATVEGDQPRVSDNSRGFTDLELGLV